MARSAPISPHPNPLPEGEGDLLTVFYTDKLYDGRFANNGWLQELPDPMTRLTWDNAAVTSENTARAIRVKQDELVELVTDGASVLAPVFFLPGMAEGVIGLALGYGRTAAGGVGQRRRRQRIHPANDC